MANTFLMYIFQIIILSGILYLFLRERKKSVQLKKSETRYRNLIENINEVYFVSDTRGKTLYVSPNVISFSGYPAEYYIGKWSHILIYKQDFKRVFVYLRDIVNSGVKDGCVEFRAVKRDGSIMWVEQVTRFVRDDEGKILEFRSVARDITARKEAEEALHEYRNHLEKLVELRTSSLDKLNVLLTSENEKLKTAEEKIKEQLHFVQSLIDTIPNPMFFLDSNKLLQRYNKAFENFYKVGKDEAIGKSLNYIFPEWLARVIDEENDDLLGNPRAVSYESIDKNDDGTESYYMVNKATYTDINGVTNGIAGVVIDITMLKRLEKEISNTLAKEKEWSELKSRFISYASHEFRTPLTSILSSADLLEMYGPGLSPEKFTRYVGIIQGAVDYMTRLTDDVLTISKSETNNILFSPSMSDLKHLIQDIVESSKLSCPSNVNFIIEYNTGIKVFNIDTKLLTQIMNNLISNAVKYSPDGGDVTLTVNHNNDLLSIAVTDEGVGIPVEDIQHLCEPFYRGRNVGHITGTGLGLTIVKKMTEIHNGTLEIDNELKTGTKITLSINLNYSPKILSTSPCPLQ